MNNHVGELERLRRELADLSREFKQRTTTLEARIAALSAELQMRSPEPSQDKVAVTSVPEATPEHVTHIPEQAPTLVAPNVSATSVSPAKPLLEEEGRRALRPESIPASSPESLLTLLGPLGDAVAQCIQLLQQYREEGKLPALVMSVVGGLALVLGSGYLLQYSFNQLLSEWTKIAGVALLSLGLIGSGVWVSLRKDAMAEYGASVIAVGLTLAYLTVYFAGPYYRLVTDGVEIIAIAVITGIAYVLALRFETRLTATLTVSGGACAPLFVSAGQPDPLIYGGLLALLAFAGVRLALQIKWRELIQVTFVLTAGLFEYTIWDGSGADSWSLVCITHAMFYLYSWALLFDGLRVRNAVSQSDILVLAANLFFLVLTLLLLAGSPATLSSMLTINAVPFAAVSMSGLSRSRTLAPVFLLIAGVLVAVALFAWFGEASLTVFWALEGTLLIYLGFRYGYRSVRFEGVLLLACALINTVMLVADWRFGLPEGAHVFDATWLSLAATFVLLSLVVWLFERAAREDVDQLDALEHRLMHIFAETQSVWFAGLFMITAWLVWRAGTCVLAIIPMYALLYRAATKQLYVTESVALLHVVFLVWEIVTGASSVGNFRFTDQPLMAQLARLELFTSLWGWHWFYQRFFGYGHFVAIMVWTRELFFLALPLVFLPSMLRRYPAWFPCVTWVSCVLAWQLQCRVELRFIRAEHFLLVVTASGLTLAAVLGVSWGTDVYGVPSLLLGVAYFGWLMYRERGLRSDFASAYELLFVGAFYYLGACVLALAFNLSANIAFAASLAALFFFGVLRSPLLRPLRGRLHAAYLPAIVLVALASFTQLFGGIPLLWGLSAPMLSVAAFAVVQLSNHAHARVARSGAVRQMCHAVLHLSIVATYVCTAAWLSLDARGAATSVLFVVHATLVLFLTLRRRFMNLLWISISLYAVAAVKVTGYDIADFSLVEKIVVFMLIGSVLLVAAYQYQSLRNRMRAIGG